MISAAGPASANNSNGPAAPKLSAENPTKPKVPSAANDFIAKLPAIVVTPFAIYPTAVMSAQVKGGASYPEAFRHMLRKIRCFPNPSSGSGAYVFASTASRLPATLADPLKRGLTERGVQAPTAEKLALGFSAVATGLATNFRNFAFTDGKHGLDGKKIFRPLPVGASLARDTITGFVYAQALQARPQQTRLEKVQHAVQVGVPAGAFTSVFDVIAYVAAKEKLQPGIVLRRTLLVALIRSWNVATGAAIMAALGPEKAAVASKEIRAVNASQAKSELSEHAAAEPVPSEAKAAPQNAPAHNPRRPFYLPRS